jgi:signal transduction histidine kinase
MKSRFQTIDPAFFLREVGELLSHRSCGRVILIDIRYPLAFVQADPGLISFVVAAVVEDAIKSSPENSSVVIGGCTRAGEVLISVSHEIAEKRQSGLDLRDLQPIMKAHRGRLWQECESEETNTILLSLPRHFVPVSGLVSVQEHTSV